VSVVVGVRVAVGGTTVWVGVFVGVRVAVVASGEALGVSIADAVADGSFVGEGLRVCVAVGVICAWAVSLATMALPIAARVDNRTDVACTITALAVPVWFTTLVCVIATACVALAFGAVVSVAIGARVLASALTIKVGAIVCVGALLGVDVLLGFGAAVVTVLFKAICILVPVALSATCVPVRLTACVLFALIAAASAVAVLAFASSAVAVTAVAVLVSLAKVLLLIIVVARNAPSAINANNMMTAPAPIAAPRTAVPAAVFVPVGTPGDGIACGV
jgi:hypothetical protein